MTDTQPTPTQLYRVGYHFACGSAVIVAATSPEAAAELVETELEDTHADLPGADSLHFECDITDVEAAPDAALARPAAVSDLVLDARQAQALRELVRYVYDQEACDWAEREAAERHPHIFTEIRVLALACGHVSAEDLAKFDTLIAEAEA